MKWMLSRSAALALILLSGGAAIVPVVPAAAQYDPPGYGAPPYYHPLPSDRYGAPERVVPPADIDDDGMFYPPNPYGYRRTTRGDPYGTAPDPLGPPDARSRGVYDPRGNLDPNQGGLPADDPSRLRPPVAISPNGGQVVAALPPEDQPETGERKELAPRLKRQMADFQTKEPAGTIVIDTPNTYLYLVTGHGKAVRYGIGVGRDGFTWSGTERVSRMSEWPDWYPPTEMIQRQPYLPRMMAGGPGNPLGARALYLGNTLYRIHGTNQPSTIGQTVSSGCIRLTNEDIEDLFSRVTVGTRVVVLPGRPPMPSAANAH
jgi:lipoprotein-anchoring transpeptidase ErfK/SrfK